MLTKYMLSTLAIALFAIASTPAFADESSSSSSSSASSVSSGTASSESLRVERCKRFSRGDDYERCVRLIRRIPAKDSVESVDASGQSGEEWKWVHFYNKIEDKALGALKYISVMSKKFCRERTDENSTTSRECMLKVKAELKTRIDTILDEVFRADLPSSR